MVDVELKTLALCPPCWTGSLDATQRQYDNKRRVTPEFTILVGRMRLNIVLTKSRSTSYRYTLFCYVFMNFLSCIYQYMDNYALRTPIRVC